MGTCTYKDVIGNDAAHARHGFRGRRVGLRGLTGRSAVADVESGTDPDLGPRAPATETSDAARFADLRLS